MAIISSCCCRIIAASHRGRFHVVSTPGLTPKGGSARRFFVGSCARRACGCRKPRFRVVTCGAGDGHADWQCRAGCPPCSSRWCICWPADWSNCWYCGLGLTRARMSNSWCSSSACCAARSPVRDPAWPTGPCCRLHSPACASGVLPTKDAHE